VHGLCGTTSRRSFLECVITADETWCYQYDPKAKSQSMEWRLKNSPRPEKPRMSKFKKILICFFNSGGITHLEFVPEETTVNQTLYLEVLKRLIDAVRCKQGELWRDRSLLLHHDNVSAHSLL
jgi:hypothetical protein